MKPPVLLSYVVFLIITTRSLIPSTTGIETLVYDVSGKKVLNNGFYHVGPVKGGGGIKLTNTKDNKKPCPSYVVQDPAEVNKGDKFIFTLIVDYKPEKYLLTSHVLGIDSGRPKVGSCENWTNWQISDPKAKPPYNLVTTGSTLEKAVSCFQVVDYPKPTSPKVHSYMLQHCPTYFDNPGPFEPCYNVSLYEEKGVRYLASSGSTPSELVFQRANL